MLSRSSSESSVNNNNSISRSPGSKLQRASNGHDPVPEFITSSIQNYKEGKEYYENARFDHAREKFLASVHNLSTQQPDISPRDLSSPPLSSCSVDDALSFVDSICGSHSPSNPPLEEHLPPICLPSKESHVSKLVDGERSLSEHIQASTAPYEDTLQGIICAILADNMSALANCEEAGKGNWGTARALLESCSKLQKMLYGADAMHCVISVRSLAQFFDTFGCITSDDHISDKERTYAQLAITFPDPKPDYCCCPDSVPSEKVPCQEAKTVEDHVVESDHISHHAHHKKSDSFDLLLTFDD